MAWSSKGFLFLRTGVIIGAVTGPITAPESILAGLYRDGQLRIIGRRVAPPTSSGAFSGSGSHPRVRSIRGPTGLSPTDSPPAVTVPP